MNMTENIVILGGSIAGVFTASELRKEGYEGKITIVESENRFPYDKPPLSKEWMQDNKDEKLPLLKSETFFEDNNIQLILNTKIVSIDTDKKQLFSEDNQTISYDKLVLATGVEAKKWQLERDIKGLHYLSGYQDAVNIKEELKNIKKNVVIAGGGFIGLELAASFKQMGQNVTLISRSNYPLGKTIGSVASNYIKSLHQRKNVDVITDDTIKEIKGDTNIEKVITTNGLEINCDLLIIGIGTSFKSIDHKGSQPLKVNNEGYIVDEYGQTSIKNVYAIGDCAVWPYNGELINVKHWENAYNQGKNLAKNLINGHVSPFEVIPYFWSDQYTESFEYLGYVNRWDNIIVDGYVETGEFCITYLNELGKPTAVFFANGFKDKNEIQNYLKNNM
jgi:3-phenylpropionate/trans-cinnamate dioxygenase ferredoxin reductase subunit